MFRKKDKIPTSGLINNYHEEMKKYLEENSPLSLDTLRDKHDQIVTNLIKTFSENLGLSTRDPQRQEFRQLLDENYKWHENENYMNLNWTEMGREVAIGIDLGTVNSVTAVYVKGKVKIIQSNIGEQTTPSCVAFKEDGQKLYGKSVESLQCKDPTNTVHDVKRLIGRKMNDPKLAEKLKTWQFLVVPEDGLPKIRVFGRTYHPEEISALLLAEFKRVAEEKLGVAPIKKAVITVPAYFNDDQRKATLNAGHIAGLEVLSILNEPTAAAIAYKLQRLNENARKVVIFDLGGGTFDCAVLNIEDEIEIIGIDGDTNLGGIDFDVKLMNYCIKEFEKKNGSIQHLFSTDDQKSRRKRVSLLSKCEDVKKRLSSTDSCDVFIEYLVNGKDFEVKVTRTEFEELIMDDLTRMMKIMAKILKDAEVGVDEIDEIVLVGGSTRIPKLQQKLKEFFPGRKLNSSIDPDQAVAYGAAMQAALLNGTEIAEKNFTGIQDVTPMSFGIEAVINGVPKRFSKIIKRNAKYPAENQEQFETHEDNQEHVDIRIYQGESEFTKNNFFLGEFKLSGIPRGRAGSQKIWVIMKITAMGTMNVEAICKSTGSSTKKTLTVTKTRKT